MRTLLGILFQLLYMSFASGSVFLFTSVIAPLKPVVSHPSTHLPRMSIRMTDFSLPMAALEDDYNVGEMEDEVIPQNIPARVLAPGAAEMKFHVPVLRIPSLKMQPNTIQELSYAPILGTEPVSYKEQSEVTATEVAVTAAMSTTKHPHYWIEGKIQLVDGLALASSQDKINVGWMFDGNIKREGRVSINEGTYAIRVDQLQGELVAELADSKGFIVGEATLDLEKLARDRGDANLTIGNVDLKLTPYNFGFRARTLSVYDTPSSRLPIAQAQVSVGRHDLHFPSNDRGQVKSDVLSAKSTALLYAGGKGGHRETVVIADFAKEQNLRMFPEKYVKALFDAIELPKEFRDQGVVWGQVLNRGVPTGGYRVRLSEHREVKPIYFDLYIPMKNNGETSSDGQYAFVGLLEGYYEIEVVDSTDAVIDTKLVYVQAAAVSTVEFEVARAKTVYVKYFDPFRTQPRPIEYVSLGQKSALTGETETAVAINTFAGEDPLLLFARTENADTGSATFASRTHKYQEIPVLDHSWFSAIAEKYKFDKKQGVIVGFVDAQEQFNVFLDKAVLDYKVLYFDVKGNIISPKDVGRQRAGFIFYNTSSDLHTVLIETNSGQMVSELAYVDGEAVAVLYKSL